MPAETEYREPTRTPTRDAIEREAGLVLLEFGTAWCGHCHALAPRIAELLERHPEVRHIKVEDGPGEPLGRAFQVRLWPNLVFLREGQVVRQLARPGYEALEQAFRELVGQPAS